MENKKKRDWLDWVLKIVIVLGIVGTIYFGFSPAKNYMTAKQEEAKIEEVAKKVVENTHDYPDVKEIKKSTNEDVVGWIRVPGTNIDEPILQSTDNEYYLKHSLTKEELDVGSIFLDAKANSNYDNNFNFVFGHNTYIDNKFTQLRKFSDSEFNKVNKTFYIFTDKNEKITYKIIGQGLIPPIFPLYTEDNVKLSLDNLTEYQKYLKEFTDITQESIEDIHVDSKIAVLTTCLSYNNSDGRQIVVGLEVSREKY